MSTTSSLVSTAQTEAFQRDGAVHLPGHGMTEGQVLREDWFLFLTG